MSILDKELEQKINTQVSLELFYKAIDNNSNIFEEYLKLSYEDKTNEDVALKFIKKKGKDSIRYLVLNENTDNVKIEEEMFNILEKLLYSSSIESSKKGELNGYCIDLNNLLKYKNLADFEKSFINVTDGDLYDLGDNVIFINYNNTKENLINQIQINMARIKMKKDVIVNKTVKQKLKKF